MLKNKITELPVGTIFNNKEILAIKRVLKSGIPLTRGKDIFEFEKKFANYIGAKYAITTSSCGGALNIATKILNLKKGDNIICQANAFWVTINALLEKKIKVIPIDVDSKDLNIDPKKIENKINKKTKAIFVVHFAGAPVNMIEIKKIAKKYNLPIIEDCAHACGSKYKNKFVGSNSDMACFSFSTHKNISTLGEGGMFVTNNKKYAELAEKLRTNFPWGIKKKRKSRFIGKFKKPNTSEFMKFGDAFDLDFKSLKEIGSTYRMTTVQAAVGIEQLKKLKYLNNLRKKTAKKYFEAIENTDIFENLKKQNDHNSYYIFPFYLNIKKSKISRDKILEELKIKFSIILILRYWPVHLSSAMRFFGYKTNTCPIYEKIWFEKLLCLPIEPQLSHKNISRIIKALKYLDEKYKIR